MNNPQGGMHPDDKRNLIIFFALCLGAFFLYDHFIHQPNMKALEAQKAVVAAQQAQAPEIAAAQAQEAVSVEDALASGQRIVIDNPDLSGSLSLKGGRIDDLALRQYFETTAREKPVTLLAPARTPHPLYLDFGWLGEGAMPDADTPWRAQEGGALSKDHPVILSWSNGRGLTFERTYTLDDQYMFTVVQKVTNNTRQPVTLHAFASVTRKGMPADYVKNAIMHEGPIGLFDGDLKEISYKDLDKEPRQEFSVAEKSWAGFTDKYWFSGVIPADAGKRSFRFIRAESGDAPVYQIDVTGDAVTVNPGQTASDTLHAYVGPKKLSILNSYHDSLGIERFDLVIDFGMFWFLTIPFFHILTWLGHTTGSFAVAILIFTCILRLAVFPLANKSYRSFARMRKIQPKMLEVREKYGDDRAKLQAAIFELYKKENVNPMAGCLPILVQIPIFFSLYKVLYVTLEMRHAPFWGWIDDMSAPDPYSVFNLFGLIPWDPPSFLMIGPWAVLMGLTMFMQQRMNPPAQDPMQARILSFMPVMIMVLMAHFPAGLVIYWTWSNCLSVLQQYVLMRQEGLEVHFFRRDPIDIKMKDVVAHGPNVHPAQEEIKEDLEAIEGEFERVISPPKPKKKR